MRKMISALLGVFVVLLAMAVPAQAQYRRGYDPRAAQISAAIAGYDQGYRQPYPNRGYGYYDPYLERTMNEECYQAREEYKGMQGTFHVHEGQRHFRPCDPTNNPIRAREGAAWGGVIGGAIGAGIGAVAGGRRGAVIGAVIGAPTGMGIGGKAGARNEHDDCLIVEPTVAQSAELSPVSQPVEVPIERKLVRNRFENAPIRVYDGASKTLELSPGDDGEIQVTASSRIWGEAYLENPKSGKTEWVPLQLGKGIDNLPENAGWVFGNPETRPSLD